LSITYDLSPSTYCLPTYRRLLVAYCRRLITSYLITCHPTTSYVLPISYDVLLITYYLFPITYYLLPTTYHLFIRTCYLFTYSLLPNDILVHTYYLSPITYHLLLDTYCRLSITYLI